MAAPSDLSYLRTPVEAPINYTTVFEIAQENALLHPNEEVLVLRDLDGSRSSLTNVSLYQQSEQLARYLVKWGVTKGDMVALVGPQTLEMAVGTLGIMRAGGIVLNVMVDMSKEDVRAQFQHVHPKFFLVDFGKNNSFLHAAKSVLEQYKGLSAESGNSQSVEVMTLSRTDVNDIDIAADLQNIKSSDTADVDLPQIYPEDKAIIFRTSGSTSNPKLVCHTHFEFTCTGIDLMSPLKPFDNVIFNNNNFAFSIGSIISNVIRKEKRIILTSSDTSTGQIADFIWNVLKEEQCRFALLSTFVIPDLLKLPETVIEGGFRLQCIGLSGQVIDNSYTRVLGRFCDRVKTEYGCTEALGIAMKYHTGNGDPLRAGDVGKPYPGVELRVVDAQDNPIKRDLIGNVQVRSPRLMKEYVGMPELTKRVFTAEHWYRTGDVGKITPNGNIILLGRERDVIYRGSQKIYSSVLEAILKEMEAIRNVCVVSVPDLRLKEEVCVCYVPFGEITAEDVKGYLNQVYVKENTLGGLNEIPSYILPFNAFPRLWNGKVDKITIRQQVIARLGLSEERYH